MAESHTWNGQSPPPLPKGGSYEVRSRAKGVARWNTVRNPKENRSNRLIAILLTSAAWTVAISPPLAAQVPRADIETAAARLKEQRRRQQIDQRLQELEVELSKLVPRRAGVWRPAGAPVAPVAAQPSLEELIPEAIASFRPILRVEFRLVKARCKLTKDQRRSIALAGERALRATSRQYTEVQVKRRGPRNVGDYPFPDPRAAIQQALAKAVKDAASGEEAAHYETEVSRQNAFRREAMILSLVARIDDDLCLSNEQREQVRQSLQTHWADSWSLPLEMFQYLQTFPSIDDEVIVPHLTESQKVIWRTVTVNQRGLFVQTYSRDKPDADEVPEDEELKRAREDVSKQDDPK